jgi:hypothetical protein
MFFRLKMTNILFALTAWLVGCEPIPPAAVQVHQDLSVAAPVMDASTPVLSGDGPIQELAADAGAPTPDDECRSDSDCQDSDWCNGDGHCEAVRDTLFFEPIKDGMTRVGAAPFSLVPDEFESWEDNAGDECPDNRPGRFDGRLDDPKPEDPCLDIFDDANGNGKFDAIWLGGPEMDRPATHVDLENPPGGRALVFTRDEDVMIVLALDLYALDRGQIDRLSRRLRARLGLLAGHLAIHVTGVRSAPDAVGLSGPSRNIALTPGIELFHRRSRGVMGILDDIPMQSGVDPTWFEDLIHRSDTAIRQAVDGLRPVLMRQSQIELPLGPIDPETAQQAERMSDAESDSFQTSHDEIQSWRDSRHHLARETQLPGVTDPILRIVSFDALDTREPHVVVMGWGGAPNLAGSETALSADYVGRVRQQAEMTWPNATSVWLTSAASDTFSVGAASRIPLVNESGQPMNAEGMVVTELQDAAESSTPQLSLARFLVDQARTSLTDVMAVATRYERTSRSVWLPLANPLLMTSALLGILPVLRDWTVGGVPTAFWVGQDMAPGCGGHGCLRYRLDKITLGGGFSILTVPGALDQGFVRGRASQEINYADARNLSDLDGDGILDADDEEILVSSNIGQMAHQFVLRRPANPQRFQAISGLGDADTWIVGRVNGGLGSFRPVEDVVNVFEGQLDHAIEFAETGDNANLMLCGLGYPCLSDLTLSSLLHRLVTAQPSIFANISVSHELWCRADMPAVEGPTAWHLDAEDGTRIAEGDDLIIGPGNRVFSLGTNFGLLRGVAGAELSLPSMRDTPWVVGGVVEIELRWHPNAGDIWDSVSLGRGGDLIYNAVCEMKNSGPCMRARRVRADPNAHLPRTP